MEDLTRISLTFDDASESSLIEKDKAAGPPAPSVSAAAVPRVAAPAPAAPARVLLAYSNESKQVAEGTGNACERLKNVLLEMSEANMLNCTELIKSRYPQRLHKHKTSLFRCLELVQFAGDEADLKDLVGTDADERRHVASRLETSAHAKLLEFEGLTLTIELNEKLQRHKSAVILGMDTRIKECKARIWKAFSTKENVLSWML